jgi:ketosteroid isomerase-like protein
MVRPVVCFFVLLISCSVVLAQTSESQTSAPLVPASVPGANQGAPGAASSTSPEIREFQKIEDTWSNAINQRDQYSLELVLSPLFLDVSASGDITTRNQQVAQLISGEDKTLHLDQRVVTVRLLGDTAVANGTYVLHHKVGSNQSDEKGVYTHVFEKQRGGWICVNSQRTVLREETPNAKARKKSDAELPFHIPLFSKGDKNNQ